MTLSFLVALGLAVVTYLVSKKYGTGMVRWLGYGVAVVLALAPAETAIHWLRGFLPAFLGG